MHICVEGATAKG